LLGGLGLLSGLPWLPVLGGGLDVGGGVDGGDCVGQVALASITDPSGQVLVVGEVVDGGDCVHDGSVGFFVQSTGGGVPVVQLFVHDVPVDFPPDGVDAADDVFAV